MPESPKYEVSFSPQPPKLAWLAVGVVALFLLALTVKEGIEIRDALKPKTERTISLSAEGKVSAAPDTAQIQFSVISRDKRPQDTQAENAGKMNAIVEFLKSQGVEAKDIKTSAYSLSPRYYYPYDYPRIPCPLESEVVPPGPFPCPPKSPVIIGYEVQQTVTAKIRKLDTAGALLEGAVNRGANQVGDVQFFIDEPDAYKAEARQKAFQNAKEKAQALAKEAGVKLGKVITFSEGQAIVPLPYRTGIAFEKAVSAEGVAPTLEPGSQDITVTVNVVFEIK